MTAGGEHWVFGYGSLMWRPGFPHLAAEPALIHGHHRALCIFSHIYRGTPEKPGLVMGLDHGGSCHGMAFRVDPASWEATVAYLREREQVMSVYIEVTRPVRLLRQGHRAVLALTYLVDTAHPQYAGDLSEMDTLRLVRQGSGQTGSCRDYVLATRDHLTAIGIHDARLEKLAAALQG